MKKSLIYVAALLLLTAHVAKWYFAAGVNVGYHFVPLAVWTVGLLLLTSRGVASPPRDLRALAGIKVAFLLAIVLTAPTVLMDWRSSAVELYSHGLMNEIANTVAVCGMIFFVTCLDGIERRKLLDLYLVAVVLLAAYSAAQLIGGLFFNTDLDRVVSQHLLFGATADLPSITDDQLGFFGQRFYRVSGVTGDPNVNAAIFAIALPVVYLRARERSPVLMGLVAAFLIAVAICTLSFTVNSILAVLLIVLSLQSVARRRQRGIGLLVLAGGAIGLVYLVAHGGPIFRLLIAMKTGGSARSHAQIAIDALTIWSSHPMGVGSNGFSLYSQDFSAHNSYLQTLVELGPIGLLVVVVMVIAWVMIARRARNPLGRTALLSALVLVLAANGHDMLNRIEFQLTITMLLSMAATGGLDPLPAAARVRAVGPSDAHIVDSMLPETP